MVLILITWKGINFVNFSLAKGENNENFRS